MGDEREASQSGDRRREGLLESAEAHRNAAQVAMFAGDDELAAQHLHAAKRDEEAAAATRIDPQP